MVSYQYSTLFFALVALEQIGEVLFALDVKLDPDERLACVIERPGDIVVDIKPLPLS